MPAWRRIAILIITALLTGCANFYPQPIREDVESLRAELLEQQEQMASQQVLMNTLLGKQGSVAEQQQLGFANLQDQMQRLRSATNRQLASRKTDDEGDACPIVTTPVPVRDNGERCGGLVRIGSVEGVRLLPPDHLFEARVDTGANTSSLDARDIEIFERDGDDYVRFRIAGEHFADDESKELERPVARFVEIVQASSQENERRPVVELKYRIGPIERVAEFTLSNRERLTFPALIGRNVLRDLFTVDVSEKFALSEREELKQAAGKVEAEE